MLTVHCTRVVASAPVRFAVTDGKFSVFAVLYVRPHMCLMGSKIDQSPSLRQASPSQVVQEHLSKYGHNDGATDPTRVSVVRHNLSIPGQVE